MYRPPVLAMARDNRASAFFILHLRRILFAVLYEFALRQVYWLVSGLLEPERNKINR